MSSLRIVAADDDRAALLTYAALLPQLGHEVVGLVGTGRELVETCSRLKPDLVITDIKMPDMEGIAAIHEIYAELPVPVILVSGFYNPRAWEAAVSEQIVEFLIKPISRAGLEEKIEHVLRLREEFAVLEREAPNVRQALRNRKLLERAKHILMRGADLREDEAFEQVYESALQQAQPLVTTAQRIIAAAEATTM
ncbi:MAG TPA: response regulator [Pirellulales bacterium]|jgi:response regulator NasT|nr:response regulator [Pirellulales bacterium]